MQEEVAVEEGSDSDLSLPVPSRSSAGKRPARIQAPAAAPTLPYPRNSSEAALAPGLRLIAAIEDAHRLVSAGTAVTHLQEALRNRPFPSVDQHKQLPQLAHGRQGQDIESAVRNAAKTYCRDQSSSVDPSSGWVQAGRLQRAPSRSTAEPSAAEGAFPGDVVKSTVYGIVNVLADKDLGEDCLLNAGSSFLDIGSGYGNVVFQAATCIPTLPCVGIEFKHDVWQKSREILATLRIQGSRLDNVALHFGEAAQFIASSGSTFTHIYFFDKERRQCDLQPIARALATMPWKIFCSAKTANDWAKCGLFLTEVRPKGRGVQFKLAVSQEEKKVHFYKKYELPPAVTELLEVIKTFLFRSGHCQNKITMGIRAILQAFSPLSRWALAKDDDDEPAGFVFPPLVTELVRFSALEELPAGDFTDLFFQIDKSITNMTEHGADVARWAITDYFLAWPHYLPEFRYEDLDLSIDLPELKGLSTFKKLQKILRGNLEGVKAPWKKKLEDNLFKWDVHDYGSKKGWGLVATQGLAKNSYIAIYGGEIFSKNKPPRVQTHVLHFANTQAEFAINGYDVRTFTKIAQGALANDSLRDAPNSQIAWVSQSSSSVLGHLSQVPILQLTKDISAGTEIVFKYSPNSQYPASINYKE